MTPIQRQERIESLLDTIQTTDDSIEAARAAGEMRRLLRERFAETDCTLDYIIEARAAFLPTGNSEDAPRGVGRQSSATWTPPARWWKKTAWRTAGAGASVNG